MNTRHARWAGVEFQPDLKNPQPPVRLGLVLHEIKPAGESALMVIGRMPRMDARPSEFQKTSQMAMEIASQWVHLMAKENFDGPPDDLLSRLADRWHWNLYVIEPIEISLGKTTGIAAKAKALYKTFVGEPFEAEAPVRPRKPRSLRDMRPVPAALPQDLALPPAWLLDEIMRHRLGTRLAR